VRYPALTTARATVQQSRARQQYVQRIVPRGCLVGREACSGRFVRCRWRKPSPNQCLTGGWPAAVVHLPRSRTCTPRTLVEYTFFEGCTPGEYTRSRMLTLSQKTPVRLLSYCLLELSYFCRTKVENADVVRKNGSVRQVSSSEGEKVRQMSSSGAARARGQKGWLIFPLQRDGCKITPRSMLRVRGVARRQGVPCRRSPIHRRCEAGWRASARHISPHRRMR
jgi:hypothetical protein